jgi:hypothetical protein
MRWRSMARLPDVQIHAVEQETRVNKKYTFPFFKQMMWYVLCECLRRIAGSCVSGQLTIKVHATT